jgi:hypothetical protein
MNIKIGDYVKMTNLLKDGDLYYGTVSEINGEYIHVNTLIGRESTDVERYEHELEVVHRAEVSS